MGYDGKEQLYREWKVNIYLMILLVQKENKAKLLSW